MSKIIEALESVRVFGKKDVPSASSSNNPLNNPEISQQTEKKAGPSSYQMTQQELADVYFARSGKTAKPAATPTLIRVEDKRRSYLVPWAITTCALLLCSVALFSTKRVMIQIQFQDVDAPIQRSHQRSQSATHGSPSRQIRIEPTRFTFSEGASGGSSVSKESVLISNRDNREQAYAAVEFDPAFNASGYVLQFEAKGMQGGETLELVFQDIRRQSSLNAGAIRPFPIGLTSRWERTEVAVPAGAGFDAARIARMRFDIGSRRTGNPSDTSISIRNVRWVPQIRD